MQFSSGKITECVYTIQKNVPWLTVAYMAAVVLLPVGLHTDFSVLFTRVDMLLSFMPD